MWASWWRTLVHSQNVSEIANPELTLDRRHLLTAGALVSGLQPSLRADRFS